MGVLNLKKGQSGYIVSVGVGGEAGQRLRAMGVAIGEKITVLSFSIFKGAVLILCGNARVAIRRSIAQKILVEKAV